MTLELRFDDHSCQWWYGTIEKNGEEGFVLQYYIWLPIDREEDYEDAFHINDQIVLIIVKSKNKDEDYWKNYYSSHN